MRTIDLDALKVSDVPAVLEAVNQLLLTQGFHVITDNVFLRPDMLAKRWGLSLSCLGNWRYLGGGPFYMKTGPGLKAKVRYPMLGKNGVLDFEAQRLFNSTSAETYARSKASFTMESQ